MSFKKQYLEGLNIKMKKNIDTFGLEFQEPNISINWELNEEELVSSLNCAKNETHTYSFDAKLLPENIIVFNVVTFNEIGYKLEVIVSQTKVEKLQDSKVIYIDENNNNTLKDFLQDRFGSPKLFSKLFSMLNKPFYIHRWSFNDLKITHKYQDSVSGFYESLTFIVKWRV